MDSLFLLSTPEISQNGPKYLITIEIQHVVMDYHGEFINTNSRQNWESSNSFVLPVMPTTLSNVCRLLQIHYILKVGLENEKGYEIVHMQFPITVATVPFRIPNSANSPTLKYGASSIFRHIRNPQK